MTLQDKKGALATTKTTAAKQHLKTGIRAVSNFIRLIPFYSICQMLANFFGVDSEEKENCSPVFTSFTKRETEKFTLHSGNNGKKCTKKRDACTCKVVVVLI